MAQISINEATTFRWSFEEDVAYYHAAGVRAMGVWRAKLSDYGEERGAELLAEYGMTVSNLMWAGGFTGSEGPSFEDMVADAADAIRLAAAIGAGSLILYSGGRSGHTWNYARRLLRDALSRLDPIALDLGVTLALEPMHPTCAAPCTVLTTIDETLAAIDAAACRATKLAFDTYHLGHGSLTPAQIAAAAPHVAIVHLADARGEPQEETNRCRLGEGRLPLAKIVAALAKGGYDGWYDVELYGEDMQDLAYEETIAHSLRAFSRLSHPARVVA